MINGKKGPRRFPFQRENKEELRINEQIRVHEVRLVAADGRQRGVVPLAEALQAAREAGLDLVEVAPMTSPPVCRLLDYKKYRYEKEKQKREGRSRQRATQLKELRFRPRIEDHDYQTKMRSLMKFLKRGNKVKVTLVFRGREMVHQEFGQRLLERVLADVAQTAQVERPPAQEGRFVFVTLVPNSPTTKSKATQGKLA